MELRQQVLSLTSTHRERARWSTTSYIRRTALNVVSLGAADFIALGSACLLSLYIHTFFGVAISVPAWGLLLFPGWYCGAMLLHLFPGWGLGPVEELRRISILLLCVFVGTAAVALISWRDGDPPTTAVLVAFLTSAVAVPYGRSRTKQILLDKKRWGIPADVYGTPSSTKRIVSILRQERGLGYDPSVIYNPDPPFSQNGSAHQNGSGYVNGNGINGRRPAKLPDAPVAVFAIEGYGRERTTAMLEGPLSGYRTVIVVPDLYDAPSLWVRPRDLSGVIGLEIRCNLCNPVVRLIKRSFDVVAVLATMPFWLPLCAITAGLIWLEDRANPFFYQERVGQNGRTFRTCKFRTMHPDAEARLIRALENDPELRKEWQLNFKLKEDPRVTKVGRLLRRYSLDEFPQLLNVLRGEMSLVGPRPLPAYHQKVLSPRVQELRLRVKPGITGLWQVSGRSDAGNDGIEVFDPYYVRNWSLWLDTVILVRTLRVVTAAYGAY